MNLPTSVKGLRQHLAGLALFSCLFLLGTPVWALDSINLAQRISTSFAKVTNPKYSTVAFSRVTGSLDQDTINELIDYTNVAIVRTRTYRVIDRSKLQLILKEQKFNLSGMVSPDTYKELGKLLGVDLFIYGRYYGDSLVMKAIDVESSAIVWADVFQTSKDLQPETQAINLLAERSAASLEKDLQRLKGNKINQISFWSIATNFDSAQVVDLISVAITNQQNFQVVDRANLRLILEEQKLSMTDFIDEQKAKKMGELYGIDAFIYGRITVKNGGYLASLKLLNIYNGVIEWADLIPFELPKAKAVDYGYVTSANSPAQTEIPEMISIPAGEFLMGKAEGPPISQPQFKLKVAGFQIDRREVSNRDYEKFVRVYRHRPPPNWPAGQMPKGQEDLPVVMVNWDDANRYCKTQGKRLPKESEWEKAYRGENGLDYPWGVEKFQTDFARTVEGDLLNPQEVESYGRDKSPYGVINLAGNVREWVDSSLEVYPGSAFRSSKVGREMVIRGGSWAKPISQAAGWIRGSSQKTYGWKDVGFRCAR